MSTGDKAAGMVGSIAEVFPKAKYQRCTVHFYRNVLAKVPKSKHSQSRGHAQGHPLHGVARGGIGQGRVGGRRARVDEAEGGRKVAREGFAETLT